MPSDTFSADSLKIVLAAALGGWSSIAAHATDSPARPIHVVVPYAGGSASDVVARIMFREMQKTLGQPIIDDNMPGAGGDVGTASVSRAAPDGYTLLVTGVGPLAANRSLLKKLDYDPEKLEPISQFVSMPNIIVVSKKLPVKTLSELIAYAKAHPKELNYGTVGFGSSQHLSALYFQQLTGTEMTHVPYRQISQFPLDFAAGQVPLGFQLYPNIVSLLKSNNATVLAVADHKRLPILADVPTAEEAGVKNYDTAAWLALLAPGGTPKPIIEKVYSAMQKAMEEPEVIEQYKKLGAEALAPGPDALKALIRDDTAKWHEVIDAAGIHPM
jgi:tripartite-type tricarboxylate transporter receptor subunit TctC